MGNPYEQLIPQAAGKPAAPGAARATGYEHLIPGGAPAQLSAPDAAPAPSTWEKVKNVFTGELDIDPAYKDAPEFAAELARLAQQGSPSTLEALTSNIKADLGRLFGGGKPAEAPAAGPDGVDKFAGAMRSTITSDPAAALDILKKQIPGLEAKKDAKGNLLLRAPGGEWAYLNKPGFSARDLDELGTQTLATLPLLGFGGAGTTVGQKMVTSGLAMGAGELARQGMEVAAGSDQGLSPTSIAINAGLGGLTANGVGGKIKEGVGNALEFVTRNPRNLVKGLTEEGARARAGEIVSEKFAKGARSAEDVAKLVPDYNPTRAPIGSPAELEARAKVLLADPTAEGVLDLPVQKLTRVADIGGAPMQDLARWAGNVSGEARQPMERFAEGRYHGQADRMADMWQDLGTSKLTANKSRAELDKLASQVNRKRYGKTFSENGQALDSPVLTHMLDSESVQKAVNEAAQTLTDYQVTGNVRSQLLHEVRPLAPEEAKKPLWAQLRDGDTKASLEFWDMVKRKLDQRADDALASKVPDKAEHMRFSSLAEMLREDLDTLVPSYRETRSTAESFFKGRNALDAGHQFASWQGRHQNEQVGEALAKMNPAERELFRRGYIDWHLKELPELRRNSSVVSMYSTPAMQQRAEMVLGKDKAEVFTATVLAEDALDYLRKAFGNSTTARQLAAMGVTAAGGGLAGALYSGDPMGALTGALLGAGFRQASAAAASKANQQVANQVAKLLLSADPKAVSKGVNYVAKHPSMADNLRTWLTHQVTGSDSPAAQRVMREAGTVARGAAVREANDEMGPGR